MFQAVRIFLPAMFVSCAVTAGLGLLSLVQYFWIKQEVVGSSESKLNNIFGLVSSPGIENTRLNSFMS